MSRYKIVAISYNPNEKKSYERKLFLPIKMDEIIQIDLYTSENTYQRLINTLKDNNYLELDDVIQIKDEMTGKYLPIICDNKNLHNIICQLNYKSNADDYNVSEFSEAFDNVRNEFNEFLETVTQEKINLYFAQNKSLYEYMTKYIELRDKKEKTYDEKEKMFIYKNYYIKNLLLNYSNLRYLISVLEPSKKYKINLDSKNYEQLLTEEKTGQMSFLSKK